VPLEALGGVYGRDGERLVFIVVGGARTREVWRIDGEVGEEFLELAVAIGDDLQDLVVLGAQGGVVVALG